MAEQATGYQGIDEEEGTPIEVSESEKIAGELGIKARWQPKSMADVEWLVEKIAAEQHRAEVVQIMARRITADAEKRIEHLQTYYADAADVVRPNLPKNSRSLKTLFGLVGFRKKPGSVRVEDKQAAEAYANEREWADCFYIPEPVPQFRVTPYLDHFAETGELLPGLKVVPEEDTFYVKVPKVSDET